MLSLDAALQRIREAGYKITGARRVVLEVLHEQGGHLTSAEVLEHVEARDPAISRASVFRALELLTSLAIIRPTFLEPRTPTYVLMSAEGHHSHIICTRCSRVIELTNCYLDEIVPQLQALYGMQLTGHLVEFYGICAACAGAAAPLDPPA
ncbi:MAG: Fur family transcriptional regulator [Anaerolineae bacterium]